jgi:regulator of CtrA degradation
VSEPDTRTRTERDPIQFGRTFVQSEAFRALFAEGMELVEETASYLDGPGREASRSLDRRGAATYASESMRLTTRLMQITSWLLLQRAVAEGEISPRQAQAEKNRVRLNGRAVGSAALDFELLPPRLRELVGLSARLHARIQHLDQLIAQADAQRAAPDNPVAVQQWLIARAFDGSRA